MIDININRTKSHTTFLYIFLSVSEYEWWDIAEIKDGTMKWSALREKEDGTRYTTTFTWKKVQLQ